jgi:5'/3'-nucleotidase SurE
MPPPLVLVVNDDGFDAPGLRALAAALSASGDLRVAVVAPETEQSGVSHSMTLFREITSRVADTRAATWGSGIGASDAGTPASAEPQPMRGFRVAGTPVDCVKLAPVLLGELPDVVCSGINRGAKVGMSVHASGTLGAAREAAIQGYPSAGFSLDMHHSIMSEGPEYYAEAAQRALPIVRALLAGTGAAAENSGKSALVAAAGFVNVNFPNDSGDSAVGVGSTASQEMGFYVHAQMGASGYADRHVELPPAADGDGMRRFRLEGHMKPNDGALDNEDMIVLGSGRVAVTFLPTVFTRNAECNALAAQEPWCRLWGNKE